MTIAVAAGTTGVRALVVDDRARVVDVAYGEITQFYPRPGWVEHDAAEIWTVVRATLAEVAGSLGEHGWVARAIGITNQRETVVALDRRTGELLHRALLRLKVPADEKLLRSALLPDDFKEEYLE